MMRDRDAFKPRHPRTLYFVDGVRVPKHVAVRAVILHLVLTHSSEWCYAEAERRIAINAPGKRRLSEINGVDTANGLIWAEQQFPKQPQFGR